ncbi:MAG: hypothetical protein AB7Q37_08235 [Pyrinomonadaceae bacterium]
MSWALVFTLISLMSGISVAGQSRELPRDEFFGLLRKAGAATDAVPHRSTTTTRSFEGGVAKLDQIQTREALPNGNLRLIQKSGEEIIEVITVHNKNFQRDNGGKWRKVNTPENVMLGRTISGPYTSEYSTSQDKVNGQRVIVLTWSILLGNDQFSETKTFVASNGRIVREESRGGSVDEQKTVTWDEVVVYDYNVGSLIIRAPIR